MFTRLQPYTIAAMALMLALPAGRMAAQSSTHIIGYARLPADTDFILLQVEFSGPPQ